MNSKKLEQSPHWVKVSDIFRTDEDAPFLQRAGIKEFSDPNYSKYSKRLARVRSIRKYIYRMDVLERALSYDEVTQIFVRVNSLGTKLRSSDLALAQITAKWRGALVQFQNFQEECSAKGFNLDMGLHLKNLISFCTGQSRFLTVSSQSSEKLKAAWSDAIAGMEFAINFLKSNLGIESPALLASPYLLIMIGFHAHRRNFEIDSSESKLLRQWALLANAKGRYSRGSSETLLDQDLAVIRGGKGASELIERLRSQVGRLEIVPEELEGRNQNSALFKTMFIAFKEKGAKDWSSNLAISLDHNGSIHKLQFHHIFPKATLKERFSSRESDDISNLAFIGGRTNRKISDKLPKEYLTSLMGTHLEQMQAQCIPKDSHLLELEVYKDFLNARRKAIAERLNEFLSTDVI
ncbi:MAG: hypothetical protein KGO94_05045 [Alphaproteobacteria bacterium]|nr:hypothetical protein [Alphaproteobacteria bacterium]